MWLSYDKIAKRRAAPGLLRVRRLPHTHTASAMDVVKRALKQQLPAYLKARPCRRLRRPQRALTWRTQALPLPDTFEGFAELTPQQWATLAPLLATLLAIVFLTAQLLPSAPKKAKPECVRPRRDALGLLPRAHRAARPAAWSRLLPRAVSAIRVRLPDARCGSAPAPPQAHQHAGQAGMRKGAHAASPAAILFADVGGSAAVREA